ncbi:tumor necrosis factor receptor superfamily member 5 isoform X3 [Paroedura picta]|uniref:tumor necrosis factor receptor superfamily member 5 isoform X3 n=1 Tax=Paroedura picta TaxID=143630 RepID=UPI004056BAE4
MKRSAGGGGGPWKAALSLGGRPTRGTRRGCGAAEVGGLREAPAGSPRLPWPAQCPPRAAERRPVRGRRLFPCAAGRLGCPEEGQALDPQQNCSQTQYEAHGRCCRRCPQGMRVRVPCTEGSATSCGPCPAGQFQSGWTKERECTPHRYCDRNAGLVVLLHGNATQNAVCRCQNGTHCSGHECQICQPNKDCGPGEGVGQAATHTRDTTCIECPVGFFSNLSSATAPCQRWSSCETTGLVHKANGTRFSDTLCEEAPKARLGVLVPLALAAVTVALGCVGLLLWLQRRQRLRKEFPQWRYNEGQQDPLRRQPEEDDDDDDACPDLPTQETQPSTQADGKESRLAEPECP